MKPKITFAGQMALNGELEMLRRSKQCDFVITS